MKPTFLPPPMTNDLLHQIALTLVPNIGDVHAKALVNRFGNAESIFKAKRKDLENLDGIGTVRANCIKAFSNFNECEEEIKFIEQYKISALFITDKNYPQRLLNCYDSPALLYYRGKADLNAARVISIVGTRNNSEYGKMACEKFLEELAQSNILIVSGLAFGIDTIAHKASLKNNLSTIGVLAHGLDMIYPAQNKTLAKQMVEKGGLLTEFMSKTNPDKQNFPKRNRIVAGMCDAALVIESGKRGGSLITAELANSYNKDIFCIPGRINDIKSEGCNYLIKNNKAALITSAGDLLEMMNWKEMKKQPAKQRQLFIELTADEKTLMEILQQQESIQIDQLYFKSGLNSSSVAAALLSLEMQGILISLPGKVFKLA
ncbi:MAG: DNA-processing protein DprA [Ferruginibacter sp.]